MEDLKATIAKLKEQQVIIVQEVQNVGGNIFVATIADPFGNIIGLIENPEFKLPA